jgi:predicted oxidoreductase (fatty acid repression mutant protein)
MIEDVKDKPLNVPSGFIVVGGIIVVIIVGAFAARFYNYKVNKKLRKRMNSVQCWIFRSQIIFGKINI